MSKDRKKLLHIHSSVNDKQPTPETLELGELGINNAKGNAFISTKNSDGEVVRFSEDDTIINWMEMKEVFPYKGYVRGSGETQVNGVTEQDLLENKSNLIIKINQVAAQNSEHDLDINGAKDIYGNLVNPMSPDGMRDGAGFAIDMSLYAMQGANPSFSSITTTCNAKLEGTTKIMGSADSDCGSKLDVKVENVDVQSFDSTVLKSDNSTLITSPVVDTNACNHISSRTNNFVVTECVNGEGSVVIDTTNVNVSANTIYNKSCDGITSETNNFVVTECNNGEGSVTIDTTAVNVSADTTNVKSCEGVGIDTDSFVVTECNDGEGDVIIDTTNINVSANTSNIKSCEGINVETSNLVISKCENESGSVVVNTSNIELNSCSGITENTDDLVIAECNDGEGNVTIDTTDINVSANTTNVESCGKILFKSDDIEFTQCGNSGKTVIKSCDEIRLESRNITLASTECGESGQTTIETDDLCLVGSSKINVYGDETNVGLDCDGSEIATNTRVFGNGTLITTDSDSTKYAQSGNVEVFAVSNICEEANDTATFYGAENTNIGVDCNGEEMSTLTTLKGEDIDIIAASGITESCLTISLDACTSISNKTNDYSIVECDEKEGQVNIETNETFITTNLLKVDEYDGEEGEVIINTTHITENANTVNENTDSFNIQEVTSGGNVNIDTTYVNVSASTTNIDSCEGVNTNTDSFILAECNDGEGNVTIDTTDVNVSADTTNIKSCETVDIDTDNFVIAECNDGEGDVTIDTTNVNVSADTTNIKSCEGVNTNTDNFVIAECNEGSGNVIFNTTNVEISADTTEVKSCSAITLESDSLVLRGCTEDGKVTISTNDLCLVGEEKVNVYGNETNIGLDCVCEAGTQNIADKTRVFGKGVLITNEDNCDALTTSGNVQVNASQSIISEAKNIFSNAQGTGSDGTNMMFASNYAEMYAGNINPQTMSGDGAVIKIDKNGVVNELASKDICEMANSAATFYGAANTNIGINCDDSATAETTTIKGNDVIIDASLNNLGITAKENILESSEGDITVTANESICEQAGDTASFYGVETTRVGKSCDGSTNTNNLEIGGSGICIDADDRISVYGANKSDLGISCDESSVSHLTRVVGEEVHIGENTNANSVDIEAKNINIEAITSGVNTGSIFVAAGMDIYVDASGQLCVMANETAAIAGRQNTWIGGDCGDDELSSNVSIKASDRVNIISDDKVCVRGSNSYFCGEELTIIGADCSGDVSNSIEYNRTPEIYHSQISSTTVDAALDEVFDRSKVTVVPTPSPSGDSGETWITYTLYQDNQNIGEINVLKDHLIEDARVVYGTVADDGQGGQTFTPCNGSSDCHWYIELKWFVKDGSHIDKYTYLDANAFVKDISAKTDSNRGVNVDVWYDSVSGMNFVSADTTLHFSASTSGFSYEKRDGEHWISATTLEFVEGSFSAETYNPFKESKTVKVPTSMQHLSQYNGSCYEFDADVCMSGHTIVAEAFYNTSDINLKENIKPIDDDTIAKVNEIEFKSFNFKADESKKQVYGVIAQDVENVGLSNLVNKNNDGVLSVDYIQLLVLKIQSLENEIKQLKEELNKK